MEFTYEAYRDMLNNLKREGYLFANYSTCDNHDKCVILRHDIDTSLDKAVKFAELEANAEVKSTYFALLSGEFYNLHARTNRDRLLQIHEMGHDIGLHFDEKNYEFCESEKGGVRQQVLNEVSVMEQILGFEINSVSMHRPSSHALEADYDFGRIVNSYSKKFFKEYKYLSDSRRRWREDVMGIIESGEFNKLHILTHAFWYSDENKDITATITDFIGDSKKERYDILDRNITELNSVVRREDIE